MKAATRWRALAVIALLLVSAGCGGKYQPVPEAPSPASPSHASPSSAFPAQLDVAAPYTTPEQPPQQSQPLDIRPTRDARDRLSKVLTGDLVDSVDFHRASSRGDEPMSPDGYRISFMTPSGSIICAGAPNSLVCLASGGTLPRPPRPVDSPPGNWEPYITFSSGGVTYGVSVGNPMTPATASVLPYGATLRFGDIECLSARDGITCVHFPSSAGFHLSRDDLTPMKATDPVPADLRVEPRTPGNEFCGAIVSRAMIKDALKSLPNDGGWQWTEIGPGDYYTCRDVQLFQAGTNDAHLSLMPSYVLVFDRGRFVSSATDRAYVGLRGEVDESDPALIHLIFLVDRDGKQTRAEARARYQDGRVALLDPIPAGATPAT